MDNKFPQSWKISSYSVWMSGSFLMSVYHGQPISFFSQTFHWRITLVTLCGVVKTVKLLLPYVYYINVNLGDSAPGHFQIYCLSLFNVYGRGQTINVRFSSYVMLTKFEFSTFKRFKYIEYFTKKGWNVFHYQSTHLYINYI